MLGVMGPETRYASAGDLSIAYQALGEGERDLVVVAGFANHVELQWESPLFTRFARGLAGFLRVILFDRRGTGLSDRVEGAPALEERMEDVLAVMDAAGSERAVLLGISEGAPMSVLFAATYPERTSALVLFGGMARSTWAPDYPWAPPADGLVEASVELIAPYLYTGDDIEIWMPSFADDPEAKEYLARFRRSAASPKAMAATFRAFLDVDVRHVLPSVRVPTLVLHRRGDRVVNRRAAAWMAGQIPGARYVELPGRDHFPWADPDPVVGEIREFLTGVRETPGADRVLATVLVTDIVGSTERAAELGDRRWRALLEGHYQVVRRQLARFSGREIKTLGDGILATFDGPGRAIRCARAMVEATGEHGLEIKVGIHTGEVEVMGEDVGGLGVHIAARVGALAGPGEVLVSETVKGLVAGSGLRFTDRGLHALKGVPEEWRLYAVAPAATR